MTVMFNDIHNDLETKLGVHHLDHFYWWELIYADDTMLIGKRAREINLLTLENLNINVFRPSTSEILAY